MSANRPYGSRSPEPATETVAELEAYCNALKGLLRQLRDRMAAADEVDRAVQQEEFTKLMIVAGFEDIADVPGPRTRRLGLVTNRIEELIAENNELRRAAAPCRYCDELPTPPDNSAKRARTTSSGD